MVYVERMPSDHQATERFELFVRGTPERWVEAEADRCSYRLHSFPGMIENGCFVRSVQTAFEKT